MKSGIKIASVFFVLIVIVLIVTHASRAASTIVLDSASSANTGSAKASSLTWTHTVSGSDRILIVGVSINGNDTVSTVTYRGQALTRLATASQGVRARASLWYLLNPPLGSGSVIVAMSASANFVAGAASYTGVNQTNPFGAPAVNNNEGTTASLNVTSAIDELVVDVIAKRGDITTNPITVGSGQTQRWNTRTTNNNANTGVTGGGSSKAGAGSVIMTWTWSTPRDWAMAGISLKPALPPADTTPPLRFSGTPSGVLPTITTQTNIFLSTDESATCRYSTLAGVSYGSMFYTFQTTGGINHSQLISGLFPNSTYNFYVRCQDSAGNSNADDFLISFSVASDIAAPSVPTNLSAETVFTSQINLSWNVSTDNIGVTGYRIYRCLGFDCTPSIEIGTSADNFYSDTGLLPSIAYTYNVAAYDAAGNISGQSSTASAVTDTVPDTIPPVVSGGFPTGTLDIGTVQTLMSVVTDEDATCRWSVIAGTVYDLMADTFLVTGGNTHLTNIFGLVDGQLYILYVRCQDKAGNADVNDYIISFSVASDIISPSIPTNLSATALTFSSINLSWDLSTDNVAVVGYKIFRDGILIDIVSATENSYPDMTLSELTTYTYEIIAFDAAGNESQASQSASATTPAAPVAPDITPPSTPTGLSATAISSSEINLSWSPSTDNVSVAAYRIYRDGVHIASIDDIFYLDAGLDDATTYSYTVSAIDDSINESGQSVSTSATTFSLPPPSDTVAPSIPANLSVTAISISQINLTWDASVDNVAMAGYKIFRDGNLISTIADIFYSDSGLNASTVYYYTVSAFDTSGNESAQSSSVGATTFTSPPVDNIPPMRFNGLPSDILPAGTKQTDISLSTDENSVCRYNISAETNYESMAGNFQTTGGMEHFQSVSGLADGSTYNFYVRCQDIAGNHNDDDFLIAFSIAEAIDIEPPTIPVNLRIISIFSDEIDFAWDDSTDNVGVAGYKIFRDGVQIASTQETSYSDVGVVSGITYTYTVSAYDAAGNESAISDSLVETALLTDTTSPTIFNLIVSDITTSSAVISWETDEPSISEINYGLTVGYSFSTAPSSLQTIHNFVLQSLSPNATYHYRVRSRDEADNESISMDNTFQTSAALDIMPPNQIVDLSISRIAYSSVDLSWTAPGDDTGAQIFSYDLRYSIFPITEENWLNALKLSGEPYPGVPGEEKIYTVVGLSSDATYYFAIKSSDTSGNISLISNVISGKTPVKTQTSAVSGGGSVWVPVALPLPPSGFEALPGARQISLQWNNPVDSNFVRAVLTRKVGQVPLSRDDGEKIYEGTGEEYTDINLDNDIIYYYAIYSFDREMNYSDLVIASGQPQEGKNIYSIEQERSGGDGTEIIQPAGGEIENPELKPPAVNLDFFYFKNNFHFGASNEDAGVLQMILSQDPFIYPEGFLTGYFGNFTRKAVQKFQCKYNIVCSGDEITMGYGKVGPLTRVQLNKMIEIGVWGEIISKRINFFFKPLSFGMVNDDVKRLQELLSKDKSVYPEGEITGYFGPLTKKAVERFQCKYNIVCGGDENISGYGRVGSYTRARLNKIQLGISPLK